MSVPLRFLESGRATVQAGGLVISSAARGVWKGAAIEGLEVPPGGAGSFAARVRHGLARVGWLTEGGDENALGCDASSFGFGGTGKKSHAGIFEDFGDAYGDGDTISCSLSRADGGLSIEYAKNGKPLGVAFKFVQGDLPGHLATAALVPAVCGRQFEAELCGDMPAQPSLPVEAVQDELGVPVLHYMMLRADPVAAVHQPAVKAAKVKAKGRASPEEPLAELRSFFLGEERQRQGMGEGSAAAAWVKSALLEDQQACKPASLDLAGVKEVKRGVHTVSLPSGPTLSLLDSKPATHASAVDRCYSQNVGLWDALPRGHAEVRDGPAGGPLLCEVVGLRKFGNAEERFGPLAKEVGCSRKAALETLPAALDAELGAGNWDASVLFLTKENGEMCKVTFFMRDAVPYLVVGSKNVVLAVCATSAEVAQADLEAYTEERFGFAREMTTVVIDQFFHKISPGAREELIAYVCTNSATLSGESISPEHQHIQSYLDTDGKMASHIRFFAVTAPRPFETAGLTLDDPAECLKRLSAWGLQTVETCDEAPLRNREAVRNLEQKHLLLPNREGAVVYVVVRACGRSRTALVYKWKNSWYVTVRALREKFCARAQEDRIQSRIRSLHVHHPNEEAIVEDFLGFYRWALLLVPPSGFRDILAGYWVSLKAAFRCFAQGDCGWKELLPPLLREQLGETWVEAFEAAHAALVISLPPERWVQALTGHRALLRSLQQASGGFEEVVVDFLQNRPEKAVSFAEGVATAELEGDAGPLALTVVLARGLQGSGKSTLCRGLQALLGGKWVNQDEVAAAAQGTRRRGPPAKELFLKAVERAAGDAGASYLFVDKIHTLRQHRDDVLEAVAKGAAQRTGRVALALLDLRHPEDDEGQSQESLTVCGGRVAARGAGHLSFLPQASAVEQVIAEAARHAEVLGDEEKCKFDLYAEVDMRLGREELLESAVEKLRAAELLLPEHSRGQGGAEAIKKAVDAALTHEQDLQGRWKTLYWYVKVDWEAVLWGRQQDGADPAREAIRAALLAAINDHASPASLEPIEDPHVTLLWLGTGERDEAAMGADESLLAREGQRVRVIVHSVAWDSRLGLVALRVRLEDSGVDCTHSLCANAHPHVTTAKLPEVAAVVSNDLLQRQAEGDLEVQQQELSTPVILEGPICRKLVVEPGALTSAGALPETGNPICELGLASTCEAVDIWATYDSTIRWQRMLRGFEKLFCEVTEPLAFCRGWPPRLRGKQWFTFHERPLSSRSLAALRSLEERRQLQTLHVGVLYFQAPELLLKGKDEMQQQLEGKLAGVGAEALALSLAAWRELRALEGAAACEGPPKFYVQCKRAGSQEVSTWFRQALASAIAAVAGWEPVIKEPEVVLSVAVKDDWFLAGLVIPKPESTAVDAGKSSKEEHKRAVNISKAMTQVLRHTALKHGVEIRPDGFCRAADVLAVKQLKTLKATVEDVRKAVAESDKQRFELKEEAGGELLVRAVQGHSIEAVQDEQLLRRLGPSDAELPEVCVHGTYKRHLLSIMAQGLLAGGSNASRKHVHFTRYEPGDGRVISGMRTSCEVAIYLDLRRALKDGLPFYESANEVILSPGVGGTVPSKYISRVKDVRSGEWLDPNSLPGSGQGSLPLEEGGVDIDGAYLEGGGQLVRSAVAYAALLRVPVRVGNVRKGRKQPGLGEAHVATIEAMQRLCGAEMAGVARGSREISVATAPPLPSEPQTEPLAAAIGGGGSVALLLQGVLPLMLAKSAAAQGSPVRAVLQGGTNVAGAEGAGSPQLDYLEAVLLPTLRRLFGLQLCLETRQRGFQGGGGEVAVEAGCARWPLEAFSMLEQGEVVRVDGVVYRSAGVPAHVLLRMLEGKISKKAAGAAVLLREKLPGVPVHWRELELESVAGADACGLVVTATTSTGCLLAGDSMGRKGVAAEKVGEEAVKRLLEAIGSGRCADEHLEDQLVLFMALAKGRSRLRLGRGKPTLHARTAVFLAERFGARVEEREDAGGRVLEVEGVGGA